MISVEQIDRAEKEFSEAYAAAHAAAAAAERELEWYTYQSDRRTYSAQVREQKFSAFNEADYQAESRAFILNLIREHRASQKPSIPHSAVCFYQDGNKWCAVFGDFVNLQESPAGFGDTFEEAMSDLRRQPARCHQLRQES